MTIEFLKKKKELRLINFISFDMLVLEIVLCYIHMIR